MMGRWVKIGRELIPPKQIPSKFHVRRRPEHGEVPLGFPLALVRCEEIAAVCILSNWGLIAGCLLGTDT
uniref:Uncharacterized protein n=1 Tax=Physcomitrium patens TaxID=3218 RepID=A0A2K1IDR8_PHYPA|nr:hypothetical protein PHYPA_029577 [Physcomitrium patens]